MSQSEGTGIIAGEYAQLATARESYLQSARDCSALCKPWFLPPSGYSEGSPLPRNFQSVGSRGLTSLEGRMLTSLYPVGTPWFKQELAPEVRNAPDNIPAQVQTTEQLLFLQDLTLHSLLESTGFNASDPRISGFRTAKRRSLTSTLMLGDSLERFNDDFTISVFRRDRYCVLRDSEGRVLQIVTCERLDPLTLTPAQIESCGLKPEDIKAQSPRDRMRDLYTRVSWEPMTQRWAISQECNGHVYNELEETVTPYIDVPFELAPEEHYGRGFIEQNLGELSTINELRKRIIDWAGLASKATPVIGQNSLVKESDLTLPSGVPIRANVQGGQVQDIAWLNTQKLNDLAFVSADVEKREAKLEAAMLIVAARDSERTTAFEISEVTIKELEGALGGFYAPIADRQQIPTLRRLIHVANKKNKVAALPKGATAPQVLTGIAALTNLRKAQNIRSMIEDAALLGDESLARIDKAVVLNVMARYRNIWEPGIIKSDEQIAREQQAAMKAQAQMQAAEQAIGTAGKLIENAASPTAAGVA